MHSHQFERCEVLITEKKFQMANLRMINIIFIFLCNGNQPNDEICSVAKWFSDPRYYLQPTFGYPEERYAHIKKYPIHPTDGNSISSFGNHKKSIDERNAPKWSASGLHFKMLAKLGTASLHSLAVLAQLLYLHAYKQWLTHHMPHSFYLKICYTQALPSAGWSWRNSVNESEIGRHGALTGLDTAISNN